MKHWPVTWPPAQTEASETAGPTGWDQFEANKRQFGVTASGCL